MVSEVSASIDPLSEKLGEISAKLDMVQRVQAEDRVASAAYRTEVRKDLATVKDDVSDLKNRTNNNADELADAHKELADLRIEVDITRKRWDQLEGASKLTKGLWAVFLALGGGGVLVLIAKFFEWGKPHS